MENRWRIFENALSEWAKKESIKKQKMDFHILDAGCGDGINLFGLSQMVERMIGMPSYLKLITMPSE